jgi:hypothetical protein
MSGGTMLYKKSLWGRKYTRITTRSPLLFLSFVAFGVVLFLILTLNIKIDEIKTYSAEVLSVKNELTLSVKAKNISSGSAYIYTNKNETVYPIIIRRAENSKDKFVLYFNSEGNDLFKALSTHSLFIDIPQGKDTLLYRIFVRGGKGTKSSKTPIENLCKIFS